MTDVRCIATLKPQGERAYITPGELASWCEDLPHMARHNDDGIVVARTEVIDAEVSEERGIVELTVEWEQDLS